MKIMSINDMKGSMRKLLDNLIFEITLNLYIYLILLFTIIFYLCLTYEREYIPKNKRETRIKITSRVIERYMRQGFRKIIEWGEKSQTKRSFNKRRNKAIQIGRPIQRRSDRVRTSIAMSVLAMSLDE